MLLFLELKNVNYGLHVKWKIAYCLVMNFVKNRRLQKLAHTLSRAAFPDQSTFNESSAVHSEQILTKPRLLPRFSRTLCTSM